MMKNPLIRPGMAVVVMGLGVSGKAAVKYLHSCGARVFVSDSRSEKELSYTEINLIEECCSGYEGEEHTKSFLLQGELIFLSPGIPLDLKVLEDCQKCQIAVVGELALAAQVLQGEIIAITGTNGKTTVTTIVGDLLRSSGKEVFVGGNIGRPLFEYLMDGQGADVVVVEVSSFQLELAGKFCPNVAVLLNITPDHLDRHGNLAKYIKAKKNLFAEQHQEDFAIIGGDDPICREIADQIVTGPVELFGYSEDSHALIDESKISVTWKGKIEKYNLEGTVFDNHIGRLNSAAAILATRAVGAEQKLIQKGLENFNPLPHRMQMVGEIDGVGYCNDSKATNTGAVLSALQQVDGKVILIAGGRDKGDDYALLKNAVEGKVKKIVLIGEAAGQIAAALNGIVDIEFAESMEDAVGIAKITAIAGETVLLSPACASFDMFDSYGHRGEIFIKVVQQLKAGGIPLKSGE